MAIHNGVYTICKEQYQIANIIDQTSTINYYFQLR